MLSASHLFLRHEVSIEEAHLLFLSGGSARLLHQQIIC
jgi:hypothetical protein